MLKSYCYLRTHAFRVQENIRERRDAGATATEYGILVAFIAFLIVAGVTLFGNALSAYFGRLATTVGGWAPAGN